MLALSMRPRIWPYLIMKLLKMHNLRYNIGSSVIYIFSEIFFKLANFTLWVILIFYITEQANLPIYSTDKWSSEFSQTEISIQENIYVLYVTNSVASVLYRVVEFHIHNIDRNNIRWQQDRAPAHTSNATMQYLRGQFPLRLMSKHGDWPLAMPPSLPRPGKYVTFSFGDTLSRKFWMYHKISYRRMFIK